MNLQKANWKPESGQRDGRLFATLISSRRPGERCGLRDKLNREERNRHMFKIPLQRILCPTDFSTASDKAMRYAEQLALQSGADLYLIHAFDIPVQMTVAAQTHPLDLRHQEQLQSLLLESSLANRVVRLLHAGPAGEVICWMAQEHQCDLIVMGTHGHSGLMHLIFGSIAEYVLRHARCPVLTIRDRPKDEPPLSQPLDGNDRLLK